MEEDIVNSVGSGSFAGLDDNPPVKKSKVLKRLNNVFEVDTKYFIRCSLGKRKYARYEQYVGNEPIGEEIRNYGNKNPTKDIIVRDKTSGVMQYLRRIDKNKK